MGLSQPFQVAEVFTNNPGKLVPIDQTISGFKAILAGKYDHLPEVAFYMVGNFDLVNVSIPEERSERGRLLLLLLLEQSLLSLLLKKGLLSLLLQKSLLSEGLLSLLLSKSLLSKSLLSLLLEESLFPSLLFSSDFLQSCSFCSGSSSSSSFSLLSSDGIRDESHDVWSEDSQDLPHDALRIILAGKGGCCLRLESAGHSRIDLRCEECDDLRDVAGGLRLRD